MSEGMVIALSIGGVVALVVFIVFLALYFEKKRSEAWSAVAEGMNLNFVIKAAGPPDGYSFGLFGRGHSKKRRNVMTGEAKGMNLMMCDYFYTTGSGKNSSTHSQTIILLEDHKLSLPKAFMRHEHGFFDWLGEKLGGKDIDFNDDSVFSKTFVLQGDDEDAVRGLFGPELRNFLVENKKQFKTIETLADVLLVDCRRRIKPGECMEYLQLAFGIHDRLRT